MYFDYFLVALYFILEYTTMTTYIPSLTLPGFLFENAAASILLPVAAGTAVGFSTRRKKTATNRYVSPVLTRWQPKRLRSNIWH